LSLEGVRLELRLCVGKRKGLRLGMRKGRIGRLRGDRTVGFSLGGFARRPQAACGPGLGHVGGHRGARVFH